MQILVSRAGLVLNPGQVADLVLAWRQVAGLIASLPQDRPLADDLAYSFRLPPPCRRPGTTAGARAARQRPPGGQRRKGTCRPGRPKRAASAKARQSSPAEEGPVAKPSAKAKAKPRRAAKPKARGRATRGR